MSRVGQSVLGAGGLLVVLLMAYTLAFDHWGGRAGRPAAEAVATEVAVFYPERVFWQEFRQGVRACARKGLVTIVDEADATVLVATPARQRLVRFRLHDVRGRLETHDEVRRLLGAAPVPLAVIGSSNTVLTESIAAALRDASGADPGRSPVLLIPWASAVLTARAEPGGGPVGLLDIDTGRTFRFCPNNQYQADLLVGCLARRDGGRPPRRAVIVVDRHDPYSNDLAESFHRAIETVAPRAEIVERADALGLPMPTGFDTLSSPSEEALAESLWRETDRLPAGEAVWVVLPLQEEPARRMLDALRRHARGRLRPGDSPIRVLTGDGVGLDTLAPLAGRCPFPVWTVSANSSPEQLRSLGPGFPADAQIPAEIVAALTLCFDSPAPREPTAASLRDALAALRVPADGRAAIGRSLAFRKSGERSGDDLGHVLMVRPDATTPFALWRGPNGEWGEAVALSPPAASP